MVDKRKQKKNPKKRERKLLGRKKELSEPFRELTLVKDEGKNELGGPKV